MRPLNCLDGLETTEIAWSRARLSPRTREGEGYEDAVQWHGQTRKRGEQGNSTHHTRPKTASLQFSKAIHLSGGPGQRLKTTYPRKTNLDQANNLSLASPLTTHLLGNDPDQFMISSSLNGASRPPRRLAVRARSSPRRALATSISGKRETVSSTVV